MQHADFNVIYMFSQMVLFICRTCICQNISQSAKMLVFSYSDHELRIMNYAFTQRLPFCSYPTFLCVLLPRLRLRIIKSKEQGALFKKIKTEEIKMALSDLYGWSNETVNTLASSCGTACGASDKPEEKPAACGSSCGAAAPEEKPASSCGSACGTGCGASDK